MTHTLAIAENEQIIMWVHKHPYILVRNITGTLAAGCIPIVLAFVLMSGTFVALSPLGNSFVAFLVALWCIIVWMALMTIWTNYFLDAWVVTDERIINIEQESLFHRDVTTLRFERLQDATIIYSGFLSEMLDFGTLKLHTAGAEEAEMEFEGIPHPADVKAAIFAQVDKESKEHEQSHGLESADHHSHDI